MYAYTALINNCFNLILAEFVKNTSFKSFHFSNCFYYRHSANFDWRFDNCEDYYIGSSFSFLQSKPTYYIYKLSRGYIYPVLIVHITSAFCLDY